MNKWKSGGSFGQECGLAATIKQESEKHLLRGLPALTRPQSLL